MEFFKSYFKTIHESDTGEGHVLCPFPHTDEKGRLYYESVPSAHINLDKSLFHCKVCGEGMSETAFLAKKQGISYKDAIFILKEMETRRKEGIGANWAQYIENYKNSIPAQAFAEHLGISSVANELQLGFEGEGISFPVYIYGELMDVRHYRPNETPKVKSRPRTGTLLLPFDLWIKDERPTLLCAGEKDMAIARAKGLNALTFTGGEQAFPKLFKASFKDKHIYIVYDNDQAGIEGARKVASMLRDAGAIPHVVTGHYKVCTEKGEDLWDYFMKYHMSPDDLLELMNDTPVFSDEDYREEKAKYIPHLTIEEAMRGQYADKLVSSRVSVVAVFDEPFHVPEYVELRKGAAEDSTATLAPGEIREWMLTDTNAKDVLYLMDSNLNKQQVNANLKMLTGIPSKERFINIRERSRTFISKAVVMDDLESGTVKTDDEATIMRELLVYIIGNHLRAGQKYEIQYRPVSHPLKGQQIVGIVVEQQETGISVDEFRMTDDVISSMECFKVPEGKTVEWKMNELYERSKGFIGVEARSDVMYASDLFFHTPLHFNFGKRRERAYLDAMIVGDPRTGKSQTVKTMMEMYELGMFTSLKTATVAGLLGGSDQSGGGWKTKLGLLPRNHRGAVIMEEFSGGGQELVGKLTEMRSSNRVRIARVNGSIDVPATVRMLSISNPQTGAGGISTPISQYPHGITVLLDLIGASEDIARYDFFLLVDEPDEYTSPLLDVELEPYSKESYMNRIRWVWSRTAEQIHMEREVLEHIVKKGEELNKNYNSHIKLFGPEAWKKVSRIAIACAGLVCSMDSTGQILIVTKDHVDWANQFLIDCYDNDIFRLKEYVDAQKRNSQVDAQSVQALQNLYANHAVMLQQLELSTGLPQRQLQMVSGLDQKDFVKAINQMFKYAFCEYRGENVVPTPRFRNAMKQINRQTYMPKVGESTWS